jgi:hypothetical protein
MEDSLVSLIQTFTLEARHNLEQEASDQLEGIYGWLPNGKFATEQNYPALLQLAEAHDTRLRLEAHAVAEKESGFNEAEARKKLVREAAFTWLNRFIALRMLEERRLIKTSISRLVESNAYIFWLADEIDPEARKLHDQGETPLNTMNEGPRHIAYRHFLLWQCRELSSEVSVLFDTDTIASRLCPRPSVLKALIEAMNAESFAEVWRPGNEETVGWVYAAFNSEEKDGTFAGFQKGEKVTPEQIAPATQVFTPRWVVRYLVENSLGRLWVEMHPDTQLKDSLAYLVPIEKAEKRSLKHAREITFLDPATGSMHFGLVAFDLFVEMYREEMENAGKPGWPEKPSVEFQEDIPSAIISHNLHGIDLDLRAVQLSALTLFLRARSLNPRCRFSDKNLACANVEQITGGRLDEFIREASFTHPIYERILRGMAAILKNSDNLGSLLRPETDLQRLIREEREKAEKNNQFLLAFPGVTREQFQTKEGIEEFFELISEQILRHLDNFVRKTGNEGKNARHFAAEAAKGLRFLKIVQERYDVVATNPPYMDSRDYNAVHKEFLEDQYAEAKRNLYSAFIQRAIELVKDQGLVAMITGQSFMFISTFDAFRDILLSQVAIETLAQFDYHLFKARMDTTAFVFRREPDALRRDENVGIYFRLVRERDSEAKRLAFESAVLALKNLQSHPKVFQYRQGNFDAIPGEPWVYWISKNIRSVFIQNRSISEISKRPNPGNTSDNFRFLRYLWEVNQKEFGVGKKWIIYSKGGRYRKWFGNLDVVINWSPNARNFYRQDHVGRITDEEYWYRPAIVYSSISSKSFSARYFPPVGVYDRGGPALIFDENVNIYDYLGILNSQFTVWLLGLLNPTVNYQGGDLDRLPIPSIESMKTSKLSQFVMGCVELKRQDSRESEITCDFVQPLLSLEAITSRNVQLAELETKIDHEVSRLYGLSKEDVAAIELEISGHPASEGEGEFEGFAEEEVKETAESPISSDVWAQNWVSYSAGIILSRFKVGQLGSLGCGKFSFETITAIKDLTVADGIMTNDPGQPLDLATRVWRASGILLGDVEATSRINTGLGEGDPQRVLWGWFDRFTGQPGDSFWKYHYQLYRKRPVYWPLQSPKRRYTVWVFHERLTKDTLFHIHTNIVEPRLRLCVREIADLRPRAQTDRGVRKKLDQQIDLADDLLNFSSRLKSIADRGYTPHIDDGVLLNAAPLHEILPSWPETKKAWQELEAGQYDWAQQAMVYWPEKVREKCKTDRSIAAVHGLEYVYQAHESSSMQETKKRRGRRSKK